MRRAPKRCMSASSSARAPWATAAAAQGMMGGFYIGGGVGQSKAEDWCGNTFPGLSCDRTDTAWKLFGGYQINRNIAAELAYTNFGKFKASAFGISDEAKAQAFEVSAVGAWPIITDRLSILGRLGLYRAYVKESDSLGNQAKHHNTDFTF